MRKENYHNDPWRDHFQARFEDFKATPPPFERVKRPRPLLFWWRTGVGLTLALLLGGLWAVNTLTESSGSPEGEVTSLGTKQDHATEQASRATPPREVSRTDRQTTPLATEGIQDEPSEKEQSARSEKPLRTDEKNAIRPEADPLPEAESRGTMQVDLASTSLQPLDLSAFMCSPTTLDSITTLRVASREPARPQTTWRFWTSADLLFWHLRRNPDFVATRMKFSSSTIPRLQDRLSASIGISATQRLKRAWSAYGQVSYRYIQEKMNYTTRETVLADFTASFESETSAFPRFPKTNTRHRRKVHLLGLGAGLSYQVTPKQHLGGGLQVYGILPDTRFEGSVTLSGELFYRYQLTKKLEVAPIFTYFFHQTTPTTINMIGKPYGFGLRAGWRL